MGYDLRNQNISDTFHNLLQKTGSGGDLYDLVGNKVRNLTIDGTLTAHSYVVEENSTLFTSGSTIFGNTYDDTHSLTGSFSISGSYNTSLTQHRFNGDISASGNIFANNFELVGGNISSSGNITAESASYTGHVGIGRVNPHNDSLIPIDSPEALTVTGNISASGFVSASKLVSDNITNTFMRVDYTRIGDISGLNFDATFMNGWLYDQEPSSRALNVCLLHGTNGGTRLNAKTGESIAFSLGLSDKAVINSGGDFYVDTDTLYVDASADSVGINTDEPGTSLEVVGAISSSGATSTGSFHRIHAENIYNINKNGKHFHISSSGGFHGSQERIKLIARDFISDDDTLGLGLVVEEDITNDISLRAQGANSLFATVVIPTGFTATAAMVYGSDTGNTVNVYEGYINDPTFTDKTPGGGCVVGTECNMTNVISTPTNFLYVVANAGNSSDLFYGGYVTITPVGY